MPARKSHHKATAMAQGHPTAAAMASFRRSRLPFARPQTLQTFQLLQKFAHLRREKVPQQAQHAPRQQAKATTRPQQWLKGTPRPQQWLLIGVQVCHLPGLKPSKSFKLIRVHLAAGCNFSLLEKQTAICLFCCPSPSLSLQYPPSN